MHAFVALSRYLRTQEKRGRIHFEAVQLSHRGSSRSDRVMVVVFLSLSLHHFAYFLFPVRRDLSQAPPGQFPFWVGGGEGRMNVGEGSVLEWGTPDRSAQGPDFTAQQNSAGFLEVITKDLSFLAFLLPLWISGPCSDLSVSWLWSHMPFSTLEFELYKAPALWQ